MWLDRKELGNGTVAALVVIVDNVASERANQNFKFLLHYLLEKSVKLLIHHFSDL